MTQRYFAVHGDFGVELKPDDDGNIVKHSDHALTEKALAAAKREIEAWRSGALYQDSGGGTYGAMKVIRATDAAFAELNNGKGTR